MSRAPLVSVVIGNYNYARFLRAAIDSALAQTYPEVEVTVVDDGSTDESRAIIAAYADRVTAVLKNNGGMGSTYNTGFRASRGVVIVFLDSDDVLLPTAIEQAVRCFTGTEVVKVHWPLREVDARGQWTGGIIPRQELPEGDFRGATIREGPDSYLSPATSGNAWSRRFLEQVLPLPEPEFRRHADTYLTSLAPLFGTVRRAGEPLACYRIHGENDFASRATDERNRSNLEIYETRCRVLAEWLERLGIEAEPERWMGPGTAYEWMQRLSVASEEIKAVVPPGETFILVDGAEWADGWGGSEAIAGRRALPFVERDGRYFGPPADDEAAIEELERLRRAGAGYLVFGWPTFWWLDHYRGFARYLRCSYRCRMDNERVIAFDLRTERQ